MSQEDFPLLFICFFFLPIPRLPTSSFRTLTLAFLCASSWLLSLQSHKIRKHADQYISCQSQSCQDVIIWLRTISPLATKLLLGQAHVGFHSALFTGPSRLLAQIWAFSEHLMREWVTLPSQRKISHQTELPYFPQQPPNLPETFPSLSLLPPVTVKRHWSELWLIPTLFFVTTSCALPRDNLCMHISTSTLFFQLILIISTHTH